MTAPVSLEGHLNRTVTAYFGISTPTWSIIQICQKCGIHPVVLVAVQSKANVICHGRTVRGIFNPFRDDCDNSMNSTDSCTITLHCSRVSQISDRQFFGLGSRALESCKSSDDYVRGAIAHDTPGTSQAQLSASGAHTDNNLQPKTLLGGSLSAILHVPT